MKRTNAHTVARYTISTRVLRDDENVGTVITVPAAFNQMQNAATLEAAKLAGLGKIALMQEPVAAIMADKEIAALVKSGTQKVKLVSAIIKSHKKEVVEILAILDGENPKTYMEKITLFTLPTRLLELLNDPELINLFTSQGQNSDKASSGSATESIQAEKQ